MSKFQTSRTLFILTLPHVAHKTGLRCALYFCFSGVAALPQTLRSISEGRAARYALLADASAGVAQKKKFGSAHSGALPKTCLLLRIYGTVN